MLRTIRNILILLLIGITASGMPIYANNINYSALIPNIIPKNDVIIVTTEENKISDNHIQISLGFSNDKNEYMSIRFNENNPFTFEFSTNGDIINIPLNDVVTLGNYKAIEYYGGEPSYIIFDFDQDKLNLPNGSYNLKLYPNAEGKKFNLDKSEFNIEFSSAGTYIGALSGSKDGQSALTLYFPDDELNLLLPVTRFVPHTTTPLTTTLRNLENGPETELGLLNGSPIPSGGKAGKVKDMAYVNLPSDAGYNQGSAVGSMTVNSLVNSLTSINGISKVQFQFNGKVVQDAFHGMTMDEPYFKPQDTMIYVAYLSNTNRFLLAPVPFSRFGTVTETYDENRKIPTIFESLKFKSHGIYNSKVHPIVPNEIELLDYTINNGMLTLTFNAAFTKTYENNDHLRQMMIDGIVFTFTSLEDINNISIQAKLDSNASGSQELIIYDFDQPIYINPEK